MKLPTKHADVSGDATQPAVLVQPKVFGRQSHSFFLKRGEFTLPLMFLQKNFGKPVEWALVKDHPWSTPQLRKLDKPVSGRGVWEGGLSKTQVCHATLVQEVPCRPQTQPEQIQAMLN
jgi:hypothetical protein